MIEVSGLNVTNVRRVMNITTADVSWKWTVKHQSIYFDSVVPAGKEYNKTISNTTSLLMPSIFVPNMVMYYVVWQLPGLIALFIVLVCCVGLHCHRCMWNRHYRIKRELAFSV